MSAEIGRVKLAMVADDVSVAKYWKQITIEYESKTTSARDFVRGGIAGSMSQLFVTSEARWRMSRGIYDMHRNSLDCHRKSVAQFGRRSLEIYDLLSRIKCSMTDRAIVMALGQTDTNYVRPRVSELLADYWMSETGNCKCPSTGRTVRMCKANTSQEREMILAKMNQGQGELTL